MEFIRLAFSFVTVLCLTTCANKGPGTSQCATDLSYLTNPLTSGDFAIRHASEYIARLPTGSDNFSVAAIVDTASADLVINESRYDVGDETVMGETSFVFDNGLTKSVAINAKDSFDIACIEDFGTRFAITSREYETPNYLGLAYSDPVRHPYEGKTIPFFDQLVVKQGLDNVFSLALCGYHGHSRLLLGGIDDHMGILVRNFVPIVENSAYVVPAVSIKLADTEKVLGYFPDYDPISKTGTRTILDSASSFLLLPVDLATAVSKAVEKDAYALGLSKGFPEGYFRTERSNSTKVIKFASIAQMKQFSYFEITFVGTDGNIKSLELSPLHYFKEMDAQDPLIRTFAIRETSGDVLLGQPFLENHYTFFDRQNRRIGFGNIDIACAR